MANKEKGVQVNATIPPAWDEILEDHRWNVRMTKTQVVRTAVEEYLTNHGLLPTETSGEHEPEPA